MVQFDTVEDALDALRNGKIILVTDDPDRENEGDFICAAEFATADNINFMAVHGRGLICMPMSEEYVQKLKIPQMVQKKTDNHHRSQKHIYGDFRRGAVCNGARLCCRRSAARRLPQTGTHVSAFGKEKRRFGKERAYRSHR